MKTLAAISNELFKDYLKIVSTDNLEATLDNPLVPVPFTCVASVQNQNADLLMTEINQFFNHKKIKNKDFLALDENDIAQLKFLLNLIQISSGGVATQEVQQTKSIKIERATENKSEKPSVTVKEEVEIKVEQKEQEEVRVLEVETDTSTVATVSNDSTEENFADTVDEMLGVSNSGDVIESLGVPVGATINLVKDEKIVATILDEKTIDFDGEKLAIVDGTKKAFKKAGVTGMALGLANWNYNGQSLKSLKDNK